MRFSASSSPSLLRSMPHAFHIRRPSSMWKESTVRAPFTDISLSRRAFTSASVSFTAAWSVGIGFFVIRAR